ncbi:ASCH domain-containing protein [Methylobacterium oryzae]|uniref:ASCH domain-containing protein n=1 Tax=Methylobacterium oryzae TaxID=334852 RepID=UPI001F29C1BA|nr:ASCH domain-containing protein [Methylobacterium oryzae]UIN38338.1 ASCH domain-containing protein [Methylobacterium oryzae]
MRVISVWNPYASLLVHGHKLVETRGFPAPKGLIGQRIGIASTKIVRPEQRDAMKDPVFARYYFETNLPRDIEELPNGYLLGTVLLHSCEPISEEDLEDVTEEEKVYGWWTEGRYAWRVREPDAFDDPVPVRGAQGIWTLPDAVVLPFPRTQAA